MFARCVSCDAIVPDGLRLCPGREDCARADAEYAAAAAENGRSMDERDRFKRSADFDIDEARRARLGEHTVPAGVGSLGIQRRVS